ncbi:hypothetical protein GA0061098_1007153 [Bradyrhizobium shewense]|uniref:Uncharacterized protein n=1 Tax=Bradyrhizobium shewense TaxID=1761772 RepID=A0A1C3WCH7_9BRAD|nr:hypothetical protein [Bradyrhizobium shewense]SCB37621.1 hypothetical protein GA0061098_1007153 [Bradyrhizobium shewense]
MIAALKQIVTDFDVALLSGVRSGADEVELAKIRDQAFDRLRAVKESPAAPALETIFDVAGEIGLKLDMALKVIKG